VRDRAQEARRGELITGAWQREDRALERGLGAGYRVIG
jgi:hypothetical protein